MSCSICQRFAWDMLSCMDDKTILLQRNGHLPHTVHIRRVESAAQPRTKAFLWCLPIDIIGTKKEAEIKYGEL